MDEQLELLRRLAAVLTPSVGVVPVRSITTLYKSSPEFHALSDKVTEGSRLDTVDRILGDRDAVTLGLSDIDHLRTVRREEGRATATRNREVIRLAKALRWAGERGHIPKYPLPRIRQEPERNERTTYRSEDDVRAIVAAAAGKGRRVIAAIIATDYDSGLRRREICRLTIDQVDVKDGIIEIRAPDTKAQKSRVTVLSDWAAEMLAGIDRPDGCPWVFPTKRGKPYHPRTVTRYYQEACELAGIAAAPGERNFFHDLRAGFADKHVEIGTRTPHIMKMAGWEDYRTARRYMRRKGRDIAKAAKLRLEEARRPPQRAPVNTREESAMPVDKKDTKNTCG